MMRPCIMGAMIITNFCRRKLHLHPIISIFSSLSNDRWISRKRIKRRHRSQYPLQHQCQSKNHKMTIISRNLLQIKMPMRQRHHLRRSTNSVIWRKNQRRWARSGRLENSSRSMRFTTKGAWTAIITNWCPWTSKSWQSWKRGYRLILLIKWRLKRSALKRKPHSMSKSSPRASLLAGKSLSQENQINSLTESRGI